MLRQIVLENFMSHRHTVIDLAEGLTVLVGPNNCGKSAVIEALRTVCTNLPAEMLVRHGEREARITVKTADEHTVVWRRKGATVSYVIDGREIHRLKGAVPDDLHEVLRLPKVMTPQGDTFDIHFALQKSPLFLIDESGSKAAGFFSTSSDAEKLMQMQQKHREKVRNAKARHKDLTGEMDRLARQLESLAAVDELAATVERAEEEHEKLIAENQEIGVFAALMRRLEEQAAIREYRAEQCEVLSTIQPAPAMEDTPALERLIERLRETQQVVERESGIGRTLAEMTVPPTLDDTTPLQQLVKNLDCGVRAVEHSRARVEAVMELERPPAVEEETPLSGLCDHLAHAQRQVGRLGAAVAVFAALCEAPELGDVRGLERCIEALRQAMTAHTTAVHRHAVLATVEGPPGQEDTAALEGLIATWVENRRQAAQHAVDICEIDEQLGQIEQQIRAWVEANPTCPVCGSRVEAERILKQEHRHA